MGVHLGGAGRAASTRSPSTRSPGRVYQTFGSNGEAQAFMDANYAAAANRIPLRQAYAVGAYTSEASNVYRYVGDYYRAGRPVPAFVQETVDGLEQVFRNPVATLQHDIVAYRGFGAHYAAIRGLKVGDTFTDPSFVSTSVLPSHAWGGSTNATIRLPKTTRAIYAEPHSMQRGEGELILDRGTTFRVVTPATATTPPVLEVVAQITR